MSSASFFEFDHPLPGSLKGPMVWEPTRAAGLARLEAFLPSAGSAYARTRNKDLGPEDRSNVSALSPYLSRRMITEEEVVRAVLRRHSFAAAEKFIQEVFWRTYWKGWLEMRPDVLVRFNMDRIALNNRLGDDAALAKRLLRAKSGETGITCFDAWARELVELGWLHNHARMWFASIWIFTLNLPWHLGADFFFKNLLDADEASNTLSWRWVAGLQTKGKNYVARASNIADHTNGRFDAKNQLNEFAEALTEDYLVPGPKAIATGSTITADHIGLLITDEDLHPASWHMSAKPVAACVFKGAIIGELDSPKARFTFGALDDAKACIENDLGLTTQCAATLPEIVEWARSIGAKEIVTGYAPTGLMAWALNDLERLLARFGIRLVRLRRDWDTRTWPLATGGFFKLKEKLPSLIRAL